VSPTSQFPNHIDVAPDRLAPLPEHVDTHHIDIRHGDTGPPHYDAPAPPHVDASVPHVDVGYNHWWQNWPKTHGYVAAKMFFPTSVQEVADAITTSEADKMPLRAVGGGWSFSDASLPGNIGPTLATQPATGRPDVQISDAIDRLLPLAEGFPNDDEQASIAAIDPQNGWLIGYDSNNIRVLGGAEASAGKLESPSLLTPPQPQAGYLMNTRSIKSSLQEQLGQILSRAALAATSATAGKRRRYYFHVEGGITMAELAALLEAQNPPLQVQATGGNPGATLAGSLSTATHGAEFKTPLLIDRVKAIHLVGPGGQQWWIEGNDSIANPAKLHRVYPGLDAAHIITGTRPVDGLLPQDWLNAVVVSMGCIGVIYSVVLEVFPLSGVQEVTAQTTWLQFLQVVRSLNPSLSSLTPQQLMGVLRDSSSPLSSTVNTTIAQAITGGNFSNGLITANDNIYADLAFNPNAAPRGSASTPPGDWDCWVVNRRTVPSPFDPQPPSPGNVTGVVDTVFGELGKAFGGDTSALILRIADVYGISSQFHVDVPEPHVDVPDLHADIPGHIDASEHIDVSEHIDATEHIDMSEHVDFSPHVDISGLHIDYSGIGPHIDINAHIDVGEHIDWSPHIDTSAHVDTSPHVDMSPHIDMSDHIDVSDHIDATVDIDTFVEDIVESLTNPVASVLVSIAGLSPNLQPVVEGFILGGFDLTNLVNMITGIANASDTLDVALQTITQPMATAHAMDLAQPFLTGVLASTLGTANPAGVSISIRTQVALGGFPDGGLLGAGVEIALPLEGAFSFIQSQILDKMDPEIPFFGYISVRLCPQTSTLLGMQQWPTSVMIEVVSFGDAWGIQFIGELQAAALALIDRGGDAMLHWGLENDKLDAAHLNTIPALQQATVPQAGGRNLSKLAAFKLVRSRVASNNGKNPPSLFPVFDNAFTGRLGL
jgi:hypothetical protein